MDKRGKIALKYLLGIFIILSAFLISFVLASHTVTVTGDGTSISVNQIVQFTYNITVNNSDSGQTANITQVNITLFGNFNFTGSQGTNANGTFSNTSIVLSWTNYSAASYLINGSDIKNFWFNATVNSPGTYTILITTLNVSGPFYTNITVTVNDTTKPAVTINSPGNTNYSATSMNFKALPATTI